MTTAAVIAVAICVMALIELLPGRSLADFAPILGQDASSAVWSGTRRATLPELALRLVPLALLPAAVFLLAALAA